MYYTNIFGHFNFEFIYDEMVASLPEGSTIVEIGSYQGKSTCYLAEKIKASGKQFNLVVIDNWVGHPDDTGLAKQIEELGDVYAIFKENMKKAGVDHIISKTIVGDSAGSANRFEDGTVDFLYLDAAHDYDSVKRDILAWLPKIKPNGTIAGHDYGNINPDHEVEKAVDEIFGDEIEVVKNTWIKRGV